MAKRKASTDRECVALGECRPPHKSRKDTKRWCRGRAGVEHQWRTVTGPLKSAKDGELGYVREWEQCAICERPKHSYWWYRDDAVARCHCGAPLVRPRPSAALVERWGAKSAARYYSHTRMCLECGYQPSDHAIERVVAGRFQKDPRIPCQCEVAAAKNAKRQHYEARYTVDAAGQLPENPT